MNPRSRRRWSFADCLFDEANWTLLVDGHRAAVETKPLEVLRELLLQAGSVVSKDELLDRVWPDVSVVEASLPTAIGKLRRALRDDRDKPIIETVPRIGYRLAAPVEVEEVGDASTPAAGVSAPTAPVPDRDGGASKNWVTSPGKPSDRLKYLAAVAGLGILLAAIGWRIASAPSHAAQAPAPSFGQREIAIALRRLDLDKIEEMLAAGWNPNAPLDPDRNGALERLLENCEWDPGHDQRRMLLVARTLIDYGADYTRHNAWGDTAYSIASAKRYCGPSHPVTLMLKRLCDASRPRIGDACLAHYRRDSSGAVVRQEAPAGQS